MTPTERIQLISELRRTFPTHKRLLEALADYESLAIAAGRAQKPTPKATSSRAEYMRGYRKKERAALQAIRQKEKSK